MYVWYVQYWLRWSNDPEGIFDEKPEEYVVSAKDYDQALAKARKAALKRTFQNHDEDGNRIRITAVDVRLASIRKGDELDA